MSQGMFLCAGSWGSAAPQVLGSPSLGVLQVNPAQDKGNRIQPIPWYGSLPSPAHSHSAAPQTLSAPCPQAKGTASRGSQVRVCLRSTDKYLGMWARCHGSTLAFELEVSVTALG